MSYFQPVPRAMRIPVLALLLLSPATILAGCAVRSVADSSPTAASANEEAEIHALGAASADACPDRAPMPEECGASPLPAPPPSLRDVVAAAGMLGTLGRPLGRTEISEAFAARQHTNPYPPEASIEPSDVTAESAVIGCGNPRLRDPHNLIAIVCRVTGRPSVALDRYQSVTGASPVDGAATPRERRRCISAEELVSTLLPADFSHVDVPALARPGERGGPDDPYRAIGPHPPAFDYERVLRSSSGYFLYYVPQNRYGCQFVIYIASGVAGSAAQPQ